MIFSDVPVSFQTPSQFDAITLEFILTWVKICVSGISLSPYINPVVVKVFKFVLVLVTGRVAVVQMQQIQDEDHSGYMKAQPPLI